MNDILITYSTIQHLINDIGKQIFLSFLTKIKILEKKKTRLYSEEGCKVYFSNSKLVRMHSVASMGNDVGILSFFCYDYKK